MLNRMYGLGFIGVIGTSVQWKIFSFGGITHTVIAHIFKINKKSWIKVVKCTSLLKIQSKFKTT